MKNKTKNKKQRVLAFMKAKHETAQPFVGWCLSPLKLQTRVPLMERCTRYNITPVFSINKTDRPDIAEILSEVALNTTTLTTKCYVCILPS
jgi:hypothetical protein